MPLNELLIGSTNPGKLKEFKEGLKDIPTQLEIAKSGEAPEPHYTFMENAIAKAKWYSRRTNLPVVSDDSGLIVDNLEAFREAGTSICLPGVLSMRFCDLDLSYDRNGALWVKTKRASELGWEERNKMNCRRLLEIVKHWTTKHRQARFVCAMVVIQRGQVLWHCRREILGLITTKEKGRSGFGYDPIFIPYIANRTFAQMNLSEKQEIDHRSQCLKELKHWLTR